MIELESMGMKMPEVEGHPNRVGFRGVLTMINMPSQKAPSGSGGRRVLLTRSAAEAALPSLIGMALDYAPTFDRHDARRKVGVIANADIVGKSLEVDGYLYAKDFPEVVDEVGRTGSRLLASGSGLSALGQQRDLTARETLAAAVGEIREFLAESRRGNGAGLGMSFEVTNAEVEDRRARIWTLKAVTFTGAAILRRDRAAFQDTWIALAE